MSTDPEIAIKMPGANGSVAGDWRKIALMLQHTFCETLGASDWDSYANIDLGFMLKKVGFALFGPPIEDSDYGYSDTEMKEIIQICRKIVEYDDHRLCMRNSEIWMAIIFVCLALERDELTDVVIEPVFRVPKYSTENKDAVVFIDRYCRVYKNWEDYLQNNTLPCCSYCYPKNGIYYRNLNNEVEIKFDNTPACKFTSKVFRSLDQLYPRLRLKIGLCAEILAVSVNDTTGVASFLMSIFSLYGVCRGLYHIYDRITHDESIALTNKEAQNGGALSGKEIPHVVGKVNQNSITHFDIRKLISSVLFFGHSVLNTKAALKAIDNHSKAMQEHNITCIRKVTYNLTGNIRGAATVSKKVRFLYFLNDISLSFLNIDISFCPKEEHYNSLISTNSAISESVSQFKDVILNSAKTFLSSTSNIYSIGGCIWKYLQEFGKINFPELLQLGEKICNDLNYLTESTSKVLNMVYMFIKNVANDLDKLYQEQLDVEKKLMGENFCQSSFDKKYKMSGKGLVYVCTVVLHAIQLVGDIYNILKDACRINCKEAIVTEPFRARLPTAMEEVVSWPLKDSDLRDQISKTQALQIARNLTKEDLNLNNCVVAYAESKVFVLIEDDSVNLNVVKLKCCVNDQIIVASVMC